MSKKKEVAPEPEISGEQAYEKATTGATSRWFIVTGPRFDWVFAPNKMKSFKNGQICYEPLACVQAGLAMKLIVLIDKPAGAKVGKNGQVILSGD